MRTCSRSPPGTTTARLIAEKREGGAIPSLPCFKPRGGTLYEDRGGGGGGGGSGGGVCVCVTKII